MMTMTLLAAGLVLSAGLGLYEAHAKKRGVMGWIVSIAASVVGGIALGATLGMAFAGLTPTTISKETNLAIALGGILIGVIAGSWIALWIVNRFR